MNFPHIRKTGITNGRDFCQEWRGVIDDIVLTWFMSTVTTFKYVEGGPNREAPQVV